MKEFIPLTLPNVSVCRTGVEMKQPGYTCKPVSEQRAQILFQQHTRVCLRPLWWAQDDYYGGIMLTTFHQPPSIPDTLLFNCSIYTHVYIQFVLRFGPATAEHRSKASPGLLTAEQFWKVKEKGNQSAFAVSQSHVSNTSFTLNDDRAEHFPSYALEGFAGLMPTAVGRSYTFHTKVVQPSVLKELGSCSWSQSCCARCFKFAN